MSIHIAVRAHQADRGFRVRHRRSTAPKGSTATGPTRISRNSRPRSCAGEGEVTFAIEVSNSWRAPTSSTWPSTSAMDIPTITTGCCTPSASSRAARKWGSTGRATPGHSRRVSNSAERGRSPSVVFMRKVLTLSEASAICHAPQAGEQDRRLHERRVRPSPPRPRTVSRGTRGAKGTR